MQWKVRYCAQVQSSGQVARRQISCIWMNIFKWAEYCYHVSSVLIVTEYGLSSLGKYKPTGKNAGEKTSITTSNRSCLRQKEISRKGSSVFRNVFCVCDPWARRSILGEPFASFDARIKLDRIWIRPPGSTSRCLLRCSMNVISCFQRRSNCAEEMAAAA